MCSVIRKIHQHPLPHFQIFLLCKKAATKPESILKALYPQDYFMSNAPDVLSAMEMGERDSPSRYTPALGLSTSWHEMSNLACLCNNKNIF